MNLFISTSQLLGTTADEYGILCPNVRDLRKSNYWALLRVIVSLVTVDRFRVVEASLGSRCSVSRRYYEKYQCSRYIEEA